MHHPYHCSRTAESVNSDDRYQKRRVRQFGPPPNACRRHEYCRSDVPAKAAELKGA